MSVRTIPTMLLAAAIPMAAGAQDGGTTMTQLFDGAQTGRNTTILNGGAMGALTVGGPGLSGRQTALAQSGTNAANVMMTEGIRVRAATQRLVGTQTVENALLAESGLGGASIEQTGQNIANVIAAQQVDRISQAFGPGAEQSVANRFASTAPAGELRQEGLNVANVVTASISIGAGEQLFPADSVQRVVNDASSAVDIRQDGTNVGNVLVADEIRDVARIFTGEQVVTNTFDAAGGIPVSLNQNGVNIANFVEARTVTNLTQISEGSQTVENVLVGTTLADLDASGTAYSQGSTNLVNVLSIRPSPGGAGGEVSAVQGASQDQSAVGIGQGAHGQVGNAAAIER
ncbi:hypothetical protein BCF33_0372 [Hasllibacter halocynthiae]|uniref:Curlin associated repeat-containing protein n=1 Tax=Hasllibacter halocynthiae TaxID=595589 RepID=A0A2T0X7C2_9RHOB|nr:hypothetical protein [Hasllibacter halocynthiae]PRY94774.1 hypothetical protein BCF33_0372 [Hasllibacter halocynthiae]